MKDWISKTVDKSKKNDHSVNKAEEKKKQTHVKIENLKTE